MGCKNPEEHKRKCHEYYLAHREELKRKQREWNASHKEEISARNKMYVAAHKKEILEYAKKYREEHRNEICEYLKQYRKDNAEKVKVTKTAYRKAHQAEEAEYKRNRNKTHWGHAQYQVHLAIKQGKLKKQPCEVCGAEKAEAHHDDYNKPLEVRWLCSRCHHEWHYNNKPIYRKENYGFAG